MILFLSYISTTVTFYNLIRIINCFKYHGFVHTTLGKFFPG